MHVQSIFSKWALALNDSCTSSTTRTNQFLTILDTNFRPFFFKLHSQILHVSGISFHNFHSFDFLLDLSQDFAAANP